MVIDEAHYIKNAKAQRTKAVIEVAKSVPYVIALTGTPILNRPVEAFNILNLIAPREFPSWKRFVFRYCDAHYEEIWTKNGYKKILKVDGASNLDELKERLRNIMIRRTKADVLKELPNKIRTIVYVNNSSKEIKNLSQKIQTLLDEIKQLKSKLKDKNLQKEKKAYLKMLIRSKYSVALPEIERFRQLALKQKLPHAIEFISSTVEQGEKVVVFVYHKNAIMELKKALTEKGLKVVTLSGEDSAEKRSQTIKDFQDGKADVFVGTIGAASEGITLTAASTVVFVEYDWTPAKMQQAEDRCHRIGQKSIVNSYWLALKDSIDEMFIRKIFEKLEVIEKIMGDKESILDDFGIQEII